MNNETHTCCQCQSQFTEAEVIFWGGDCVCMACKTAFIQKIREGVDESESGQNVSAAPNWRYIFTCIAFAAPAGMALNILVQIPYAYVTQGVQWWMGGLLVTHAVVFVLSAGAFFVTARMWRRFYRCKPGAQWLIMILCWLLVIAGSLLCLAL